MNILVVTLSNFGDVILTTPVIMALVEKYPEARITAAVGPRAQSVLQRSPDIHKIVIYDKKASFLKKLKFILELRKAKYDLVVDLRNTAIPFLVSCKKRTPLFRKFTQVNMRDRHLEMLATVEPNIPAPSSFHFFNKADEVFAITTGIVEQEIPFMTVDSSLQCGLQGLAGDGRRDRQGAAGIAFAAGLLGQV